MLLFYVDSESVPKRTRIGPLYGHRDSLEEVHCFKGSLVTVDVRLPISWMISIARLLYVPAVTMRSIAMLLYVPAVTMRSIARLLYIPAVSMETGKKIGVASKFMYLAIFFSAAVFAAVFASVSVLHICDSAYVSTMVTSQANGFRLAYVMSVAIAVGIHETTSSLSCWRLIDVWDHLCESVVDFLQRFCDKRCHVGPTNLSQGQVWGSQVLTPCFRPIATPIASSSRRRPIAVIGHSCSQSPECGDAAVKSFDLYLLYIALFWMSSNIFYGIGPSHDFCMCCNASTGCSTDDEDFHMSGFVETESVILRSWVGKMVSCSVRVKESGFSSRWNYSLDVWSHRGDVTRESDVIDETRTYFRFETSECWLGGIT